MKHHPGRWFLLIVAFLIGLVVLGSGPIGLAVAIMIGVPLLAFGSLESIAHSGDHWPGRHDDR